jgi:hypothetical protein
MYEILAGKSEVKPKLSRYHNAGCKGERLYNSDTFLTLALEGVSGQRHTPAELYPWERTPGTHWTEGWVGLIAGLDTEAIGKNRLPLPGIGHQS